MLSTLEAATVTASSTSPSSSSSITATSTISTTSTVSSSTTFPRFCFFNIHLLAKDLHPIHLLDRLLSFTGAGHGDESVSLPSVVCLSNTTTATEFLLQVFVADAFPHSVDEQFAGIGHFCCKGGPCFKNTSTVSHSFKLKDRAY